VTTTVIPPFSISDMRMLERPQCGTRDLAAASDGGPR
jgi:hypothetical protein